MPLSAPYESWLEPLQQLCNTAGEAIQRHYRSERSGEHRVKQDSSPLTAADLEAHAILLQGLAAYGLPVLSEESGEDVRRQRRQWSRYWLVDPLDGTREFLERTGEFTINIALIEDGRPALGLIGVPLQASVYCGVPGQGAWKSNGGAWQRIRTRKLGTAGVALTSRRHRGELLQSCLDKVSEGLETLERQYFGSALKFCLLAEGKADIYPRFSPCSEWDTAAGQALVEAAGGAVLDLQGRPLRYNQGESLLNPHFLALGEPGHCLWRGLTEC